MGLDYSDKVLELIANPQNVGSMDQQSARVGTGVVGAPKCGDVMKLQIEVEDSGTIVDAKFKTFGCAAAVASSSLATVWLKGRSVEDAATLTNGEIAAELSLPPMKIHCSVLAADAVQAAIADWKQKHQTH